MTSSKPHTLEITYRRLSELRPFKRNARRHSRKQLAQIAASIQKFGFTNPVLIADDDQILAGHARLEAAKSLGMSEIPTVRLSQMTEDDRRAYVIADNKLALNAGWDWEDYRQFFRLFYKAEDRAQATICFNEQHDLAFYYLRISSRARSGVIWTTWNYPLSYGLKLTPQFRINRQRPDQSFWQLYQSHRAFLRNNNVQVEAIEALDEEKIEQEIERDLREQIAHNITKGVLKQTPEGDVKYSWRGMVYLWCQFLLDLVRLLTRSRIQTFMISDSLCLR